MAQSYEGIKKTMRRLVKPFIVRLSKIAGSLIAFSLALLAVIIWALLGPYFKYSDGWQLLINTGTTIVTFLMAFSIQFSQDRDTREIKMMLRSLMKENKELREQLVEIERELDEED